MACSGFSVRPWSMNSRSSCCHSSVATTPGAKQFTVIWCSASARAAALGDHLACSFLGTNEDAQSVDVHNAPEVRLCDFKERAGLADSGIVEHHVQPPVVGDRLFNGPPDTPAVSHVDRDCQSAAAGLRDCGGNALGSSSIQVGNDHLRAVRGQIRGDCRADPATGTSDQSDLSINHSIRHDASLPDRPS